jgi:hypothetical protein
MQLLRHLQLLTVICTICSLLVCATQAAAEAAPNKATVHDQSC